MIDLDRVRAQLRKSPEKREIGGDRDPMGFLALCSMLPDDDDLLFTAALPRQIQCGTCRFADADLERGPCGACWGEEWTEATPYPKWRAAA